MKGTSVGGQVDGGRELSMVEQKDPMLGALLRRVLNGVNTLSTNAGISATGSVAPPKAPDSVTAASTGEMLHMTVSHGGELNRGVNYISYVSQNDPSFSAPMVYHHGGSRTPPPIPVPALDPDGNQNSYYVKTIAQYPGSPPSDPTFHGSSSAPIAIQPTGTTRGNLLPSHGAGTASNTGQQSNFGLGKFQKRSGN